MYNIIIMILDNFFSKYDKIIISIISGMLWIYFRTEECYKLVPRKSILTAIVVGCWIYLNYKDPLFLSIGVLIMYVRRIYLS